MTLVDALKNFYAKAQEAYYSFLDKLDEKGIPVYRIVDPIEAQNIPSFPIAILLAIGVITAVLFSFTSPLGTSLEVLVQDPDGNPLSGVAILALSEQIILDEKTTDSSGKAVLKIPLNKEVGIKATKPGFEEAFSNITSQNETEARTITLTREVTTFAKTIILLHPGTTRSFDTPVQMEFSCTGNDFSKTATVSNGSIDIDLASDCDTLIVKGLGNYSIPDGEILLSSDEKFSVFVEQAQTERGNAVVTVSNSSAETVAGIEVTLWSVTGNNSAGAAFETKQTTTSGTATFSSVPAGKYYIITYDRSGTYAEYDGLAAQLVQEIKANEITSFALVLNQSVVGKVKVRVKDRATGDAVSQAIVTLSKNKANISSLTTNSSGEVEFSVGEDVEYGILVDKHGYLFKNLKSRPTVDFVVAEIEQATADNSQGLLVTIVDEKEKPVENARVKLRSNADGLQVGTEIVTGLDGRAIFQRVGEGLYYVYAVKPGYGEKTGETFTISSRQENVVKVKIPIGSGRIDVRVVDEDNNPLAGANVKAVEFGLLETLEEVTTDSDGKKSVSARADKKVFLIVSSEGFLSTTTVPVQMQKDVGVEKSVMLTKTAQSFAVEFDGLYSGSEAVGEAGSLTPGAKYTAKLRMIVPRSASFDEAGVHLRAGREQNNSIEKDFIYINNVRAAYTTLVQGTSYNPPNNQATDFQRITTGNAKWANAVFRKVGGGVYEVEADMLVKEEAKIGSLLEVWYRAYGKSGGYVRAPNDSALGSSEATAQKQGLYANTLKKTFSVGPTSLCNEDFCSNYSIEDIKERITSSIFDNYSAQVGAKYRLVFEVSSLLQAPFSASQLSIKDRTSSISIESYKIKTATGDERVGQKAASEVSVSVGEISRNSVVSGEIIFEAKKDGTVPIDVSIISGSASASEVYKKTIYLKVSAAKKLSIDVLPKVIVPLINNNILVRVTDSESASAVANAKVGVIKNGDVVASGETDIEGVFSYTLLSPSDGSVIGFAVEKTGYKVSEKELKVSNNVLLTDPLSLKLSMNVGGNEFKSLDATLINYSQVPLRIEKIGVSRDFSGFADIKFSEPAQGTLIAPDANISLNAIVNPGPKGIQILQPTKILGAVSVEVTNESIGQKWIALIPLEINIGFGDEVDDVECFTVAPLEWKIFGSANDTREITINVLNSCKVGNGKVSLKNLSARLVTGSDGSLGSFRATSSIEGSKSIELDKVFRVLAQTVSDEESAIKIEFKPEEVIGARADNKIELQALHFTSTGEQKLTKKIDVSVNINNLNECVEILTNRDITVQSCPYNTGFGNYDNRFSQYSYSDSRYASYDPYAVRNGYGTGIPPYIGTQYPQNNIRGDSYYDYGNQSSPYYQAGYQQSYYPNTSYSAPYYPAEGVNAQYGTSWNCGAGSVIVKNSCASPVELSFDPQPGVIVKDRSIKIEPNAEEDVVIEPTNFFGRYAVGIKAKVSGSNEKSIDLRTVYVNVVNEFAKNYRDCISISPSRTLSFNNFIGKPVILKVYNSCYDQGVFLEATNNAITFTNSAISNPADPFTSTGIRPINSPAPAAPTTGAVGPINMIQDWAFLGEDVQPAANGKVTQVLEFEVVKNISEYRNRAPPANFFSENEFANIGNLRFFATSGYYSVQGRTNLIIRFSTPTGGLRSTYFPMVTQDFWPLLEYFENIDRKFTTYGDPKLNPAGCIRNDALDFAKLGELPIGEYSTSENGGLFIINEKGGCGTVDRISEPFNPQEFVSPTGLRMIVSHDGHETTIRFDDSKWNGARSEFTGTMISKVTRVSPAGTQIHRFPIRFIVKGTAGGVTPAGGTGTTQYSFACKEGEAGDAVYAKYGFHHLKLDWRTPSLDVGISRDACDVTDKKGGLRNLSDVSTSAPAFCDGLQSSIALAQKISEIKTVATTIARTITQIGTCRTTAGFDCTNNQTSKELFRYTLSQNNEFAYFLGNDNTVVDLSSAGIENEHGLAEVKNLIESLRSTSANSEATAQASSHNLKIADDTSVVMGRSAALLATDKFMGSEIVLEVRAVGNIDEKLLPRKKLGDKWFVVSLQDYRTLHDQISAKLKENISTCTEQSCEVEAGKVVNVKFLSDILSKGKWKLTARNSVDLSEYVKGLVMKNALWSSRDMTKYSNFAEFNRANVQARMYLINDNYNSALWENFRKSYSTYLASPLGVDGVEVSFNDSARLVGERSGDYNVIIEYNWSASPGSARIEFIRNRTIEDIDTENRKAGFASEYTRNVLFTIPIDGTINAGAQFLGPNAEFMHFNAYSTSTPILNPRAQKEGTDNTTAIRFTYNNSYDESRSGKIISISNSEVVFAPSDPIKVVVSLIKGAQATPSGVLFDFVSSDKGTQRSYILNIPMKVSGTGLGLNTGEVISTSQHKGSTICTNRAVTDKDYSGIVLTNQATGSASFEGIVYTPTRSARTNASRLVLKCARESDSSVSSYDALDGSIISASVKGFEQQVELSRRKDEQLRVDYNLKSLLEKVRDRGGGTASVCAKSNGPSLELFWNEGYFIR